MREKRVWAWMGASCAIIACSGGGAGGGGAGDGGGGPDVASADGSGSPGDSQASQPDAGSDATPLNLGDSGGTGSRTTANKIDILLSIDNSASMGDKQAFLEAAIPDLINTLVNPSCVDAMGKVLGVSNAGQCASGAPQYPPVRDMHLGIVSSALGGRLGDACNAGASAQPPFTNISAHNDDQAHLLNRTLTYSADGGSATEGIVVDAAPTPGDEFLAWFPGATQDGGAEAGPGTPLSDSIRLESDFAQLVRGAGTFGCGIESQLESWYRFLVQPDPYQTLVLGGPDAGAGAGRAAWSGVDATILRQRHDFLRPDSIVSVIVLSDENDSEIDVRSLGQQGYNWMAAGFTPPRGTSACATNPADPACISCAQVGAQPDGGPDPSCALGPHSAFNDWGYDLNLRHVHMKAKYGVDPQFPIQRYLTGLTSATVPDRTGEYPPGATSYQGVNNCTNPLFAASLPDGSSTDPSTLCALPAGARPANLVFYTHIGGVPNQLLHYAPGDVQASTLTTADWKLILGNDPLNYDYTGIDPHMIESYQPRAGVAAPGSSNTADPISGHDWVTDTGAGHILQVDREYACIFDLVDATGAPAPRDCRQPQYQNFCDCPHSTGQLTAAQLPPICDPTTQYTQTSAKAYPTIRELLLAKLMGTQGIVSSICPEHVTESMPGDPRWGYRPAIGILISHLAPVIGPPPR